MKNSTLFLLNFLGILLFSTNSFGQCPPNLQVNGSGSCYNVVLNPQPASIVINTVTYTRSNPNSTTYGSQCTGSNTPNIQVSGTFTIDGNTCVYSAGVLPVNFINYEAKFQSQLLSLKWVTVNEKDLSSFKVEISEDAINWKRFDLQSDVLSARNNTNNYAAGIKPDISP